MPAERVVYLFGAGATIAEAFYAGIEQDLTLRAVSELVVEKGKKDTDLQKIFGNITTDAIPDIELYISLLESMRIQRFSDAASKLKSIFCDTIEENLLQDNQPIEPVLTMALLQMHEVEELEKIEQLRGIVTVNYDNLVDRSFQEVQRGVNYCIKCKCISGDYHLRDDGIPLIKLHGSFNWKSGFPSTLVDESQARDRKEMLWIPPGIEKEREPYPFNMLWGKAFELLDCEKLRVVGCSLSQNDWGLISLLFKTQLRMDKPYEIQLIDNHDVGATIRERNGFLANVKILGELSDCQDLAEFGSKNVFESWLKRILSVHIDHGIRIDEMGLKYIDMLLGD